MPDSKQHTPAPKLNSTPPAWNQWMTQYQQSVTDLRDNPYTLTLLSTALTAGFAYAGKEGAARYRLSRDHYNARTLLSKVNPNSIYSEEAIRDYVAEYVYRAKSSSKSTTTNSVPKQHSQPSSMIDWQSQHEAMIRVISHLPDYAQTLLIQNKCNFVLHPDPLSVENALRKMGDETSAHGFFSQTEKSAVVHFSTSRGDASLLTLLHETGHAIDYQYDGNNFTSDNPLLRLQQPLKNYLNRTTALNTRTVKPDTYDKNLRANGTLQEHVELYSQELQLKESVAELLAEHTILSWQKKSPQKADALMTRKYPELWPEIQKKYIPALEARASLLSPALHGNAAPVAEAAAHPAPQSVRTLRPTPQARLSTAPADGLNIAMALHGWIAIDQKQQQGQAVSNWEYAAVTLNTGSSLLNTTGYSLDQMAARQLTKITPGLGRAGGPIVQTALAIPFAAAAYKTGDTRTIGEVTWGSAGAITAGMAGQTLIPLPGVGFVAGVVGGDAAAKIGGPLNVYYSDKDPAKREAAKEELKHIAKNHITSHGAGLNSVGAINKSLGHTLTAAGDVAHYAQQKIQNYETKRAAYNEAHYPAWLATPANRMMHAPLGAYAQTAELAGTILKQAGVGYEQVGSFYKQVGNSVNKTIEEAQQWCKEHTPAWLNGEAAKPAPAKPRPASPHRQ